MTGGAVLEAGAEAGVERRTVAQEIAVICGPTGAGKSRIALRLAERLGLAVVSADSRQIYRGFDVGTAKPSDIERARVPHFGVDVADPADRYSAARWAAACEGWMAEAHRAGRPPVVVGGSGLYVRALAAPFFREPDLDPERRARLAEFLEGLSVHDLRRWTAALDPDRAHLGRAQHLRALEIALLDGQRLSTLHAAGTPPARPARYLVIDPGRDTLREWIAVRTDAMLAGGWIDEVRALMRTVPPDAPAWNGTGYAVVRRHALGELSLSETRERVLAETRQYAKRQRTWYRHQLPAADVTRLDPTDHDADERALAWWHDANPSATHA